MKWPASDYHASSTPRISLDPLDENQSRELVASLLAVDDLPREGAPDHS